MDVHVYEDTTCKLGEGAFWHPLRGQFFWFDILGRKLFTRKGDELSVWQFSRHVSAAGWLDRNTLMIADEISLFAFNVETGDRVHLTHLEADNKITRSNDGRADPWGGFWIGTMGKNAEAGAGAIYRYYRGQLQQLYSPITISNAICFSPCRLYAYFTDTVTKKVMRQKLEPLNGWPEGDAEILIDLTADGLNPDGAVVDVDGNLWIAQWGASRVASYSSEGVFIKAIDMPASQITCPAFGGQNLNRLFVTSADIGLSQEQLKSEPKAGQTFFVENVAKGQREFQVIL